MFISLIMLSVDLTTLQSVVHTHPAYSISLQELSVFTKDLPEQQKRLHSSGQGFLELGDQPENVQAIQAYVNRHSDKEYFVILGIGGSMLGPKTIIEALAPLDLRRKVFCLDNIDPNLIQEVANWLPLEKTLFLVQTKSGTTPETVAQYLFFQNQLQQARLDIRKHMVFITDPVSGWLRKIATELNIDTFAVPQNVGGRFSVLTPIGLLIAALLGVDIAAMLAGAKQIVTKQQLEAWQMATASFLLVQKEKTNVVIMPYSSRLKTFSEWCVQLVAESLGKQFNLDGEEVFAGLTPIPAVGVTDQHSQLQLFKEGPHDKQIIFIQIESHQSLVTIPAEELQNHPSLDYLYKQSFNSLMQAEFIGTRQSLIEAGRPNMTITISQLDAWHLGALFMFFELYTVFLAQLWNINAFDQPGVERSKILTKEILSKKSKI